MNLLRMIQTSFSHTPHFWMMTWRNLLRCVRSNCTCHNVSLKDKVIIIADALQNQRWSDREVDPMLCNGHLAFFCSYPVTLESLRLWAHKLTLDMPPNVEGLVTVEFADELGAIAEDHRLTRCAQLCFSGAEDQAEQHDHGTIDEVV